MPLFLGLDIGTSSIKATLWDSETGRTLAGASSPSEGEMGVASPKAGWAEQDPEIWWENVVLAVRALSQDHNLNITAIGIAYQMHGLVLVDSELRRMRPSIIWCDSRATPYGERALQVLGEDYCYRRLLNSPANFTAAKMGWAAKNEPEIVARARFAMLPGDFVAMKMTGEAATTASGLSEMILWDFLTEEPAVRVLEALGIDLGLLPPIFPTFGVQGRVTPEAAEALGIAPAATVAYRAGDQPNSAFALGCLEPGDVAATAGTSGVVYGVSDQLVFDPKQRFNTFLHVNHTPEHPRYGQLLCLNGCGALYSWLRTQLFGGRLSYLKMNELAEQAPAGSAGLLLYPFGNGAERVLGNRAPGASLLGLDFLRHDARHLCRAAQEGIAFALRYGMEAGISPVSIRATNANLFLSDTFAQTFASLTGATIQIWDTDGAMGAARGAALGLGEFADPRDAFVGARVLRTFQPVPKEADLLSSSYEKWNEGLEGN